MADGRKGDFFPVDQCALRLGSSGQGADERRGDQLAAETLHFAIHRSAILLVSG